MHLPLALLWGPENLIVIGFVALLLFGKRLPEVGRSLGKGIIEFKKGLQGIEADLEQAGTPQSMVQQNRPALSAPAAAGYKFDPYTGKPIELATPVQPQMRFDPYTGKPLPEANASGNSYESPVQPPTRFDPYTGKPLAESNSGNS